MNEVAKVDLPVTQSPPVTKLPILAGGKVSAIVPRSIDEAFRLAEAFCIAGMVPDSYKGSDNRETASRVMLAIMKGAEVGLPPVAALSNIYIVNKRPSVYGDGALAIVQAAPEYGGHKEWYEGEPGTDSWIAKCEFDRCDTKSGAVKTYSGEFSWLQAKTAQLTRKGPWVSYPARMLKMRARAFGMRDSFSDALCGLGIVEEQQDITVKPEVVPTAFLDEGAVAQVSPGTPPANVVEASEPDPVVDPEALLTSIKKSFLAAGDDKVKIRQTIEAAETVDLPEPLDAELAEIIAAKLAKLVALK